MKVPLCPSIQDGPSHPRGAQGRAEELDGRCAFLGWDASEEGVTPLRKDRVLCLLPGTSGLYNPKPFL